jgi:hypothetical protein
MIQDHRVDQRELMLKFDNVIEFAKKYSLNSYPMATCHALMDCGERQQYKIFNIALKTRNNERLTINRFFPCKALPFVDNLSIALNGNSSASGVIETKCLTSCRQLHDSIEKALSITDLNFCICPGLSMISYNKCLLLSVKI